ncbi:MAG TPA: Gfo/Idh/MocA family oxidoreductase, partial [Ohtaekwangia sp.]|nr:Gfo/Idh/MocA family oxidoreductase [Ohtaekwangia sp.]
EWSDGTLCNCYSGSAGTIDRLFAACTKGYIELNPATQYRGVTGESSLGKIDFPQVFQQKLQIEDFVKCVLEDRESIVSGEEGLRDMLIIDAIHKAVANGGRVPIEKLK